MAGFFKEMFQFHADNYHKERIYKVLNGLRPEELVPAIEFCCSGLLEGFSQYNSAADRRLANRIMACIEEWGYESSIISLKEVISKEPNNVVCLGLLSSQYSGCPIDKFRNGKEAVKLARKACKLTKYKDAVELIKLAQAYAECGDFEKAIEWQEKSNKLADDPLEYKKRLATYKARKPWRNNQEDYESEDE